MLLVMFFQKYINSLTGLFIGEILGVFNGDKTILPDIINKFVSEGGLKEKITSIAVIYIVISSISVLSNFLLRTLRTIYYEKLYISISKEFCFAYTDVLGYASLKFIEYLKLFF